MNNTAGGVTVETLSVEYKNGREFNYLNGIDMGFKTVKEAKEHAKEHGLIFMELADGRFVFAPSAETVRIQEWNEKLATVSTRVYIKLYNNPRPKYCMMDKSFEPEEINFSTGSFTVMDAYVTGYVWGRDSAG